LALLYLSDVLGLAGGAHRMLAKAGKCLAALVAPVFFAFSFQRIVEINIDWSACGTHTRTSVGYKGRDWCSDRVDLRLEYPDIGKVAVLLIPVKTITDNEIVADTESDVISFKRNNPTLMLVQKRTYRK